MSPTHTRRGGGRLYRYYVSQTVLKGGVENCPIRHVSPWRRSRLRLLAAYSSSIREDYALQRRGMELVLEAYRVGGCSSEFGERLNSTKP